MSHQYVIAVAQTFVEDRKNEREREKERGYVNSDIDESVCLSENPSFLMILRDGRVVEQWLSVLMEVP